MGPDSGILNSRSGIFRPMWDLREVYPSAAEGSRLTKAVIVKFISDAICCMTSSDMESSWMHTAAEFPENLLVVNASTCMKLHMGSNFLGYSLLPGLAGECVPDTVARLFPSQNNPLARGSIL